MDEPKKGIFELLDPKSAFIVGIVGGLLTLGTIGFIIMLTLSLNGKIALGGEENIDYTPVQQNQNQTPNQQVQTPTNIPKTDKPKVELFVMSYCPYGLQMEKAYMPAWDLLKKKADFSIKFVSYAMHGKIEVDENTRQYCIQKEQPSKFSAYIKCMYTGKNSAAVDYKDCLRQAGVNESNMNSCVQKADKQFGITAKFDDQASWLSGRYPIYPIHQDENNNYGVQGSPTLVINGVQAEVGRTPEAIKAAVCAAFENAPSECNEVLSNASYQPGFGLSQGAAAGAAADPGCGT